MLFLKLQKRKDILRGCIATYIIERIAIAGPGVRKNSG